jgi:Cu/Ag efflux pump CusA
MTLRLRERFLVISLASMLLVGGLYAFKYLNIEAYPDPSPPIIEVITQNPMRYQHISNAGIAEHNPGINSLYFFTGISWWQ